MSDGGADILLGAAEFAGSWALSRRIDDALTGDRVTVTGRVEMCPSGDGWTWQEEGQMTLRDQVAAVSRRYLWAFLPELVMVSFHDGRPFHSFRPAGLAEGSEHLCGADTYRVTYDFRAWPRWRAVWRVTGPRKDYVSDTLFTPPPGPSR